MFLFLHNTQLRLRLRKKYSNDNSLLPMMSNITKHRRQVCTEGGLVGKRSLSDNLWAEEMAHRRYSKHES